MLSTQLLQYDLPANASPDLIGSNLDTWLQALGPISLVDATVTQVQDAPGRPRRSILVTYRSPGPTLLRAQVFGDDTVDGDLTAANAAGSTNLRTGMRMFDLTELDLGRIRRGRTLVIWSDTPWLGDPEPNRQVMLAVNVTQVGGIVAGASGQAVVVRGDGTIGQAVTVVNPTPNAASQGNVHYAIRDPITGGLFVFPSCCY